MSIKLVAIDIDGTLINDQRQITPQTVAAINEATKRDVRIVLCTGRPMTGVKAYVNQLGLADSANEYVICYNGALAQATDGTVLAHYTVDFDDYIDFESYCRKQDVSSIIETSDYIYTPNQDINPYTVYESNLVSMPLRYRSMDQLNHMRDSITIGKAMMTDEKEKIDAALANMPQELSDRFRVVRSEDFYLELINKQTSKGVALSALTDKLNLTADNVMAIGNAQNDESMIEFARTGVAMANSIPHTLQMADVVTESDNNHDGVAEAIKKYVLNA